MIHVLTGEMGCGKTTLCLRIWRMVQRWGMDCGGLISPARFEQGQKTGIHLIDLQTGEQRMLAQVNDQPGPLRTQKYQFDPEVMAWGGQVLERASQCDFLMIDELGPLEIERGLGWANAFPILQTSAFRQALVVVRPSLIERFKTRIEWPDLQVWSLPVSVKELLRQIKPVS